MSITAPPIFYIIQVSSLSSYSLFITLLHHNFLGSSPSPQCYKVCSLNFANCSEHSEQSRRVYKFISLSGKFLTNLKKVMQNQSFRFI